MKRCLVSWFLGIGCLLLVGGLGYTHNEAQQPPPTPSVTLPATLGGQPGIPIPITATANGKNVTWIVQTPGLVVVDGGYFGGDSKKALLFGPAGTYTLSAVTALGDVVSPLATTTITIGTPGPTPGPGPTPTPTPTDPLVQQLQAAYATCTDPNKGVNVGKVAAVFAQAATLAPNTQYTTWADLDIAVATYAASQGLNGSEIPNIAKVISQAGVTAVPNSANVTGPISATDRVAAATFYSRASTALKSIVTFRGTKGGK